MHSMMQWLRQAGHDLRTGAPLLLIFLGFAGINLGTGPEELTSSGNDIQRQINEKRERLYALIGYCIADGHCVLDRDRLTDEQKLAAGQEMLVLIKQYGISEAYRDKVSRRWRYVGNFAMMIGFLWSLSRSLRGKDSALISRSQ